MRTDHHGSWTILVPTTRRERRAGLLGRDELGPWQALRFDRCRSVHTVGMRFPIDVVLLDRHDRPIQVRTMPPGSLLLPRARVRHIVEVAAGRGLEFGRSLS